MAVCGSSGGPAGTDGLEIPQGQQPERRREEEVKREGMGRDREWKLGVWTEPRVGPESAAIF